MQPVPLHCLHVSATDETTPHSSITSALQTACAGDIITVGPGHYSPSRTQESFPLYVPAGVTLIGAGQDQTRIDGEAVLSPSFRPVQESQSLILMGDETSLSGFTIENSGGNGISNQPGARLLITHNTIRRHGQHGIILSGPNSATITDNVCLDNGTLQYQPVTPRPAAARQGHHIFVQGKSGVANDIVISHNTLTRAFADGIAMVVFFDEADGTQMQIRVWNNTIEYSQRRGLTIAGSFGPSDNRITIDVRENIIRHNGDSAIGAQTARPLATQLLRNNILQLRLINNQCEQNGGGIVLFGGFGPAEDNRLDAILVGNRISGGSLTITGGVAMGGFAAHQNQVRTIIKNNQITSMDDHPIILRGGTAEGGETATGNTVIAQIVDNELSGSSSTTQVRLENRQTGNIV